MERVVVGTSGFSLRSWRGIVYPLGLPLREWLAFYEQNLGFHAVEINLTFYRYPSRKTLEHWAQNTSPAFRFTLKIHHDFTHDPSTLLRAGGIPTSSAREIRTRLLALFEPLADSGKLRALLAQFPASFFPSEGTIQYLRRLQAAVEDFPLVFEFRNSAWWTAGWHERLRTLGLEFCRVDAPWCQMNSFPWEPSRVAYFRLHGRNPDWKLQGSDRYAYEYGQKEILEMIPAIDQASRRAAQTFVFFNNCHLGSSVRDALRMIRILGKSPWRGEEPCSEHRYADGDQGSGKKK